AVVESVFDGHVTPSASRFWQNQTDNFRYCSPAFTGGVSVMRHHFRLVAILVVCLAAYAALVLAVRWLSAPRDLAVLGGVALTVGLVLIVAVVVRTTWRNL